jgi:hypothetical protein
VRQVASGEFEDDSSVNVEVDLVAAKEDCLSSKRFREGISRFQFQVGFGPGQDLLKVVAAVVTFEV